MSAKNIFITGTSTGVGKTLFSALLLSAARKAKIPARYFKPIQTGDESDCDQIKSLTQFPETTIIRPVYLFKCPVSPYHASLIEQRDISINLIMQRWQEINSKSIIIEGAGGLLVPITKNVLFRDLIKYLNMPIIIVASTILGTINHTLLTIQAAIAADIPILGIILSGEVNSIQTQIIREFTQIKTLLEIPIIDLNNADQWLDQVDTIINSSLLKKIFYGH